ncbi:YcxB family protein [Rufibacter ruber]|uniref:YcxB family protein n=1 Tax=Rufibacter ruber TaxID=1783499 RepID=UPI000829EAC1|nr:YcxB family protein [Rufibacter ruber]
MNAITIIAQLTSKDLMDFNRHANFNLLFLILFPVVGSFLVLSVPLQYLSPSTADLPFPFVQLFVGLAMVGLPALLRYNIKRNFRKNNTLQAPITYTFTDTGMSAVGETFTTNIAWEKIYKLTENNKLIVIWQNNQIANILPKRFFSQGELEVFRELATAKKGPINKLSKIK